MNNPEASFEATMKYNLFIDVNYEDLNPKLGIKYFSLSHF